MHLCCSSGTDSSTCDADDVVASAAANAAAPIHTHSTEHTRSDGGGGSLPNPRPVSAARRPPPISYIQGESGAARFFMHTREAKVGRKSGSRRLGGSGEVAAGSGRRKAGCEAPVPPGAAGRALGNRSGG